MFGELSKAFGKTFLIAGFVPACLLAGTNVILVTHGFIPKTWFAAWRDFDLAKSVALATAALVAGMLLYFWSSQIYKIVEGYSRWKLLWIGVTSLVASFAIGVVTLEPPVRDVFLFLGTSITLFAAAQFAFKRANEVRLTVKELNVKNLHKDSSERAAMERDLRRNLPQAKNLILPSDLGNILRAAENHPRHLYNIEPISGWVRLSSRIPKDFASKIDDAKLDVTARLNLLAVVAVIAAELWLIGQVEGTWILRWLAILSAAGAYGIYRSALAPARQWGEHLRAAFDLYRLDVLKQMGVVVAATPFTLAEERSVWAEVQEATFYLNRQANVKFQIGDGKKAQGADESNQECRSRCPFRPLPWI